MYSPNVQNYKMIHTDKSHTLFTKASIHHKYHHMSIIEPFLSLGADASDISVLFFLVYCNSTEGVTNCYLRTSNGAKGSWLQVNRICYINGEVQYPSK